MQKKTSDSKMLVLLVLLAIKPFALSLGEEWEGWGR